MNGASEIVQTKRIPISESSNTIVGTFDGTSVRLYKDGVLVDTVKFKGNYINDPQVPIHIGSAGYCSSCNRWSGVIDCDLTSI